MTSEQLKTNLLNPEFIKGVAECYINIHRLKRNRMMYEVFTPIHIKIWHKLLNKKPYMKLDYEPKLL